MARGHEIKTALLNAIKTDIRRVLNRLRQGLFLYLIRLFKHANYRRACYQSLFVM